MIRARWELIHKHRQLEATRSSSFNFTPAAASAALKRRGCTRVAIGSCGYTIAQQHSISARTLCHCMCKRTSTSTCLLGFSDNGKNRTQWKGLDTELTGFTVCSAYGGMAAAPAHLCSACSGQRITSPEPSQTQRWSSAVSVCSGVATQHCSYRDFNSSPPATLAMEQKCCPQAHRGWAGFSTKPTANTQTQTPCPSPPSLPLHTSFAFQRQLLGAFKTLFIRYPGFWTLQI